MGVPDNGPLLVGVTWGLTFFCAGFLALRLYAKLSRRQGLWWDDHILIFSWFLLLVQAVLTQVGQSFGFGKHARDIPVKNMPVIAVGMSVGASISCFSSTFSKISFGVTLLRLTSGKVRAFVWFCIITLFLVMIPSALNTWIECQPMQKVWDNSLPGKCWPASVTVNYGIFNAAWCAVADFALALLPWYLIWDLQLNRREKLGVGIAMSIGVLSGVCAIVKGVYVVQLRQQDFFYNGKDVTVWTVVEIATAIIAASIPVLRVFFKEKVTSYSRSHGRSNGTKTVPLSRLTRSNHSNHTTTVSVMGKEGAWTSLDPVEDSAEDDTSQRRILRDEEGGARRPSKATSTSAVQHDGILTTNTVTVTVAEEAKSPTNDMTWLRLDK